MTTLLLSLLAALTLYAVYFAARFARLGGPPATFLDAGQALPGWAVMFLLPGLGLAGLNVERHLGLVAVFGLQASHVGLGLVVFAMAALLAWNRLWYATRVAGLGTPGEALGRVYGSVALRVVVLGLAVLFGLPFAADLLSSAASVVEAATRGQVPRVAAVWLIALSLAIPAIIGGWRSIVVTLAMQSVLLVLLIAGAAIFTEIVAEGPGFPAAPIPVAAGVLSDRIPGVVQYSAGIGKEAPPFGIFSAVAIASHVLALVGLAICPAALYLGQTLRAGRALGVSTVWLTAGLAAGVLLLCAPMLAARMVAGPPGLAAALHGVEPLAGAGFVLMLILGALLAVSFFVSGGAILVTRELVIAYLLPRLGARGQRMAARVALAFAFFFAAFMASFLPLVAAVLASVALPLAVQLLPAILGVTFVRWIGRGAIIAGLVIGALIVLFTEPPGLILFEGLFVELPWGRWPLTVHSAAWGLVFNFVIVLLSAAVTLRATDRFERDRLHDALEAATGLGAGGRGLLWACLVLWGFLAYGPGAVLGNTFFSDPIFSPIPATLGIPSLWIWQVLFWLVGVVLVWWLAYRTGLGRTAAEGIRPITLGAVAERRAPDWLAEGLRRIRGRDVTSPAERPTEIELLRPAGPPARRAASGFRS